MTDSNSQESSKERLNQALEQMENERILQHQQQGNWSTYEDPILGIQLTHPSWWEITQEENSIKFYPLGAIGGAISVNPLSTSIQYFLPPLPDGMNTLDKFMRQIMSELRSSNQNVSVNRTSTVGVDNIPAYKVESESESILDAFANPKSIHYFFIDNSTSTAYMITLNTDMDRLQKDAPLFEEMVESFKILS